jgi:hypothetical protein
MAFDLSTAKPVSGGGFDLSTAKPVEDKKSSGLGHWAGLETRNLVQGLSALPGLVADIPGGIYNAGANLVQGYHAPSRDKDAPFPFQQRGQQHLRHADLGRASEPGNARRACGLRHCAGRRFRWQRHRYCQGPPIRCKPGCASHRGEDGGQSRQAAYRRRHGRRCVWRRSRGRASGSCSNGRRFCWRAHAVRRSASNEWRPIWRARCQPGS